VYTNLAPLIIIWFFAMVMTIKSFRIIIITDLWKRTVGCDSFWYFKM